MRAAILAGGKGTRISQLYPALPKPMIPVAGKPLLQHQVELLVGQKIKEITLIIGYKADMIREHFGNGEEFDAQIDYIVEDEPLGTGGALSLLPRDDTLILLGDVYLDVDFQPFIRFQQEKCAAVSLFVHPNSHPYDSDIVIVDGSSRVIGWNPKKGTRDEDLRNLVNAGVYLFSKDALPSGDAIKLDLERDLILPKLLSGNIFAYRSTEYIKDMGTPKRLCSIIEDIKNGVTAARNLTNKQRAVFLDRDGTINEEDGLISDMRQMRLLEGAAGAIRKLNKSPFLVICVTNQPVIARGDVTACGLEAIHARLETLLGKEGAYLDDLFFCPHHPDKGFAGEVSEYKIDCDCRKPKPGMLMKAAETYNIDLARSYMIGDRTTDIAAGKTAGCFTIGLKTGTALEDMKSPVNPDIICENLSEAIEWILGVNK